MFRFEELEIWKLAIEYGGKCYDVTKTFPREELFSLADQLKRASVSISNNIAEGSGSVSVKGFCAALDISVKSILETVSILYFTEKQNYISQKQRLELYEEAEKLIRKIRAFKKSLR